MAEKLKWELAFEQPLTKQEMADIDRRAEITRTLLELKHQIQRKKRKDALAILAMRALLSNSASDLGVTSLAERSYSIAEAMLVEREKQSQNEKT